MTHRIPSLLLSGTAATVLLLAAGAAGAQSTDSQITNGPPPSVQLPPLPPAGSKDASESNTTAPAATPPAAPAQNEQQQATTPSSSTLPPLPGANPSDAPATAESSNGLPPVPIGHEGIREVQTQLIALGFDPGVVDGEAGPATQAAVRKYDRNRGGNGSVPIDSALLDRLRKDTAPRLTPEQIAARSQPRQQAQAPVRRAPADPVTNTMQQLETGLRGLFNGGN
ncbi:MAG: peptidoglycan-binding protein [Proteobacteria bacterium]|nr:peptidoglycan-binding protein [Pseudomonadota bacterium]